jgi:hypothetical protein
VAVPLATAGLVLLVLLWELYRRPSVAALRRLHESFQARRRRLPAGGYDPGRERRAEQRARALLRSCVADEEWEMYSDLGFLRVWAPAGDGSGGVDGARCAYLIYPHEPILSYLPGTGELLGEYCVAFPDNSKPYGSDRLPDSDDVLAKWIALSGDEHRIIAGANMHLPGRQLDTRRVRRDLARLARWERERSGVPAASVRAA